MTILELFLEEGVLERWDISSHVNSARTDPNEQCYLSARYWLSSTDFYVFLETTPLHYVSHHHDFSVLVTKHKYPASWAVCKEHVCSKSPAPPFAFLDLLLDAMDKDGRGELRAWLDEEIAL